MGYSPEGLVSCSIKVDNLEIPLSLDSFDISISDSIYRLCPEIQLSGNDTSGIASESRLGIIGQPVEFILNLAGNNIKVPTVCKLYETPSSNSTNGLSGLLRLVFQHSAKYSEKKPQAWNDKSPSDVFSYIMDDMNIKKISSCNSLPLIYNPGYDNEEFIDKILLKLSANGGPQSTPYYAFIDIENKAWFVSLKDLYQENPTRKIIFGQPLNDTQDAIVALKVNSFSQDYSKISSYVDETLTFLNEKHEIESQDVSLKKMFNPLALIKNTSGVTYFTPKTYTSVIDPNVEYALLNYERRKGILFDKLVVLTLLDPTLHAGLTVDADIYLNVPGVEKAQSFSGKFLIEASEYLWSASNLMGYTKLILGRPTMEVKGKELYQ